MTTQVNGISLGLWQREGESGLEYARRLCKDIDIISGDKA